MKKKYFGLLLTAMVFASAWLSQGCLSHFPTVASVVPTPLPSGVVSDFNNGTLNMNPNLLGSSTGYFQALATGANNVVNPPGNSILQANPGDGSNYAVHIYGPLYDNPCPTTYPAFNLYGFFKRDSANPYYDLSLFTHVQFDYKMPIYNVSGGVTTGDNTSGLINGQQAYRRFAIAIAPQVPPTTDAGGRCLVSSDCYNYFWGPNLSNTPLGWQTASYALTSLMTDPYYGNALGISPTPFGARSYDWTTVLFLLWKETDNGGCSSSVDPVSNIDFWVDNVKFY